MMILIVDDDKAIRTSLNLLLKKAGYCVEEASNPEEALIRVNNEMPSLCVLDLNFSLATTGEEGLAFLQQLKTEYPDLPVILITAWGSISLAVEGMKLGASDFITKPWNNDFLLASIKTALDLSKQKRSSESSQYDRAELNRHYNFENIVGMDEKLLRVLNIAGRVSRTDAPVLILGESGTGKELVAEAIHNNSDRAGGPFIKVNLGGIPSTLFESEMFGHKKGAFTGAAHDRIGRFELAHKGTLFLDEVGDLDSANQVKLLRVLQDRSFEPLGTSAPRTSDFRLICATNRNLNQLIASGNFREDLYYRINLISLNLPDLRERMNDLPLLVQYFVDNIKMLYDRPDLEVTAEAVDWLSTLSWPGNIRELKNLVERTILVTTGDVLQIEDFRAQFKSIPRNTGTGGLPEVGTITLEEMEKSMIRKAMRFHQGNVTKVALSLGLSRSALYRRLEKYGFSL